MSDTATLHKARGREFLFGALFDVASDWTANAVNYWTIELRRVRSGQEFGEIIAEYSLADRSLTANEPVVLYDVRAGLAMSDAEQLRSVVTAVGSPAPLARPRFYLDIQRIAR